MPQRLFLRKIPNSRTTFFTHNMDRYKNPNIIFACLVVWIFIVSCHHVKKPSATEMVSNPESMDDRISDNIQDALEFAAGNNGKIDDSVRLQMTAIVDSFYTGNDYSNIWSQKEKWQPLADSLDDFIQNAETDGLFPKDYHLANFASLKKKLDTDSASRTDAALWTRADLLLTDGFMHIVKDLKQGRIPKDSLSLNEDTLLTSNFYLSELKQAVASGNISSLFASLEPGLQGYQDLKLGLKSFLDSMDRRVYTYVKYPFKSGNIKDSLQFLTTLRQRLSESNCTDSSDDLPDSVQLKKIIKEYQKKKKIKQDGLVSESLVKLLNNNDVERFKRIAITLDRYKQLPDSMPEKYIWVNLPAYYLQVWDSDTVALQSRVVCGKPTTPTPQLTSYITNMITYPTWTVPTSIIVKQFLPKLKTNPYYLSKLGLNVLNKDGDIIDPAKIKWKKYTKGIPYKIMQGSGDDNALGVIKFNFRNKYAVYLHDTNERNLFKKDTRCLSHGCVRVQQWQDLAFFIIRNDSLNLKPGEKLRNNTDSLTGWLARKEKKTFDVRNRIPLFIRYFTCEGKDGKVKFYDDMYNEDKLIRDKYFANK